MMKDSLFLTMKRTILGGDYNVTRDLDRVVTQRSKTQMCGRLFDELRYSTHLENS